MNETIKQIESLAKQIEVLTAQFETKQETAAFDFQHILDEAKQAPFCFHEVVTFDEHVKVQYMHMLLTLFEYAQTKLEERYLLVGKIYYALGIETDFMELLRKSKTLTPDDARNFVTLMQEQKLVEHFVMDLLMIACVQQQDKLMRYVAEMVAALAVSEARFRTYCHLTNAILTVNHEAIDELLIKSKSLRAAVGHYLMVIHSNFAPMIQIEGDVTKIVTLSALEAKRLHLKNVQIELLSRDVFKDYEEFILENCIIRSSSIFLYFSNIRKLTLKNIQFAQCKQVMAMLIVDCQNVIMRQLYFKNLDIKGTYFAKFYRIQQLHIEDSEFHALRVEGNGHSKPPLFEIKNVASFTQQNVNITKCISKGAYADVPILRLV